jgi:Ca2+-binding RTX toxin-like protein
MVSTSATGWPATTVWGKAHLELTHPPCGADGAGLNALDYSAYQGDILVDLVLSTASLVGGGAFNMANVTGSRGNDLIVGDAATTSLVGGTDRNVLIGGGGTETITGGGGFNLLLGTRTAYDTNLAALQALMTYWDNPNATTLDQLVNPLKSKKGVTVNGQLLMLNSTTLQPDHAADSLIGGSGSNWFIRDKDGDTINNGSGPGPNDRVTVI